MYNNYRVLYSISKVCFRWFYWWFALVLIFDHFSPALLTATRPGKNTEYHLQCGTHWVYIIDFILFVNRLLGVFWKLARIGERKSPYVAVACIIMAASLLFWTWCRGLICWTQRLRLRVFLCNFPLFLIRRRLMHFRFFCRIYSSMCM